MTSRRFLCTLVIGLCVLPVSLFAQGQRIDEATSFDDLVVALNDDNANVRYLAAYELGRKRDARAVDVLVDALDDEVVLVRRQAAYALGKLKGRPAVDALSATALDDDDAKVRQRAVYALGMIKDDSAVDVLRAVLDDDPSGPVRRQAVWALSELGEEIGYADYAPSPSPSPLLSPSPHGMWFGGPFRSVNELPVEEGRLEIIRVSGGSKADRQGLQRGDRLISINGKAIETYGLFLLMRRLTDRRLDYAEVEREGQVFEVVFN